MTSKVLQVGAILLMIPALLLGRFVWPVVLTSVRAHCGDKHIYNPCLHADFIITINGHPVASSIVVIGALVVAITCASLSVWGAVSLVHDIQREQDDAFNTGSERK